MEKSPSVRIPRRQNRTFGGKFPITPLLLAAVLTSVSLASPVQAVPVNKEVSEDFAASRAAKVTEWRPYDGTNNNLLHPEWGSGGEIIERLTDADYGDNISDMAHQDWENPRVVSLALCSEEEPQVDPSGLSALNGWWGEFVRNDLQLTPHQNSQSAGEIEEEHILIPTDDTRMNPTGVEDAIIKYIRTDYVAESGTDIENPREYQNSVSSWLDGSSIYGYDQMTAEWLRSHVGGRMLVTDWIGSDYFPAYESSSFVANWDGTRNHANIFFATADNRNFDHIGIASIHLLLLREHNRLADAISENNPTWSDEDVYQRARKLVVAQIQAITYNEYLPSIGVEIPEYEGYNATVNPQLSNEFFLLVLNSLESQRIDEWKLIGADGFAQIGSPLSLGEGYWSGEVILDNGVEPLLRGGALTPQAANDPFLADGLQNLMSGAMWGGWMDDCAMDIQRGRDRGLTDYNSLREGLGMTKMNNLSDLASVWGDETTLSSLYSDIDNLDAVIGVSAEPRVSGSVFGETQMILAADTFQRLRDGDRFWYAADSDLAEVSVNLSATRLADLILRNSNIESLSCNSFFAVQSSEDFDCHLANVEIAIENSGGNLLSGDSIALIALSGVVILIAVTSILGRGEEDGEDAATVDGKEEE